MTKKFFFEDFVRVYPTAVFDKFGRERLMTKKHHNNFLSHKKFYEFSSQFVKDKVVADVGCGSGYGCEILRLAGAKFISGSDISKHSIGFAKSHYNINFSIQEMTRLNYSDDSFDVTICNEVLEHIKEYGKEDVALKELKRITKIGGLIIIGTPNSEMLGEHGFSFDEITKLFSSNFKEFVVFENALVPFGDKKELWDKRIKEKKTGIIISENINFSETVLKPSMNPELKKGIETGVYKLVDYSINTALLHNTHSWVILVKR